MYDHDERRESRGDGLALAGELPDPWDGDHNIKYWTCDGTRMVPASSEELERIHEDERTFAAPRRLQQPQEAEHRAARAARQPERRTLFACATRLVSESLTAVQSVRATRSRREHTVASLPSEREHSAAVRGRTRAD